MNCPKCGSTLIPETARFCQNCGTPVDIAMRVDIDVKKNLGRVVGVQTETIHGDVYGDDIYQVQVYVLSESGRQAIRDLPKNTPPYKFLTPYTAQDQALFKGRDDEISQVIRQIGEQRLLVIYGQAGVGKTSLLAAGIIPALMQAGALVVNIPDYRQPVDTIRTALTANAEQLSIPLSEGLTLPTLFQEVEQKVQGTLVLVFDQFERLFELDSLQQAAFIDDLSESLKIIEPEFLRVIIVIREDALGHLGELQGHLPDLLRFPFQLLPFDDQKQAKAAIEDPLKELNYPVSYVGHLVDQALIPDLDELTPETPHRIHPPYLQIVCYWLYQVAHERHPPQIDTTLYVNELKSADGIMAHYLEETLRTRLADEQSLAEKILTTMASPGTGQWVRPEQLLDNGTPPERVNEVLNRLVEAELLASRRTNGQYEYTFSSQSVVPEIRRMAGPQAERRYQVGDELERVWRSWLARDALATRGQLRYLVEAGSHLSPKAVKVLLLLRSAVACDEPVARLLTWLHNDEGRALIRHLEDSPGSADVAPPGSPSDLNKADLLLGLSEITLPDQTTDEQKVFGPIAWSAVKHSIPITRQTAALAITVLGPQAALNHLDSALRDGLQGWQRRRRRAELYGTLADGDPESEREVKHRSADLPLLDRISVWLWRARRRIFRDRHRIVWLTLGGAIGAGMGLGLLRAIIEALSIDVFVGSQFALYFYWGSMLGAALSLGMALADPLLVSRPETDERTSIWRGLLHPDRLPAVLAVLLGTLSFWMGHAMVTLFSSFPNLGSIVDPLRGLVVLVAGFGLSLALYDQPRISLQKGIVRQLLSLGTILRLGAVIVSFVLVESIFIATNKGVGLSIAWSKSLYKAKFFDYFTTQYPQVDDWIPRWPEYLALLDAALVGIVLTVGITIGLALAARWLARWRALVDRANE